MISTSIEYAIYVTAFFTGLTVLFCLCLTALWLVTDWFWRRCSIPARAEFFRWYRYERDNRSGP